MSESVCILWCGMRERLERDRLRISTMNIQIYSKNNKRISTTYLGQESQSRESQEGGEGNLIKQESFFDRQSKSESKSESQRGGLAVEFSSFAFGNC